ncbi:MAG: Ig-like domain-containing protein [Terriglobales bacterium]|jgi:hypothetical protein
MLTGRKLALTLAFTVLVALALGVSCRGFFVSPTLTSITINPTTPSVQLNSTATLSAYAVNSNGQGMVLTSGVSWSSSDPSVAAITGNCATEACGSATLQGLQIGTTTISVGSQSVTNTATATVFISVSSIAVAPTSQTLATNTSFTPLPFVVTAVTANGPLNISSSAVMTANLNGTASGDISCTYYTSNPTGAAGGPGFYCTDDGMATQGQYQLIASYTGTTLTGTAQLNVPAPSSSSAIMLRSPDTGY